MELAFGLDEDADADGQRHAAPRPPAARKRPQTTRTLQGLRELDGALLKQASRNRPSRAVVLKNLPAEATAQDIAAALMMPGEPEAVHRQLPHLACVVLRKRRALRRLVRAGEVLVRGAEVHVELGNMPAEYETPEDASDSGSDEGEVAGAARRALGISEKAELDRILAGAGLARNKVLRAMSFFLEHAEAADECVDALVRALEAAERPRRAIALLFVLSDVLHNASAPVHNAYAYRALLQPLLGRLFAHLAAIRRACGRLAAHEMDARADRVLVSWREALLFGETLLGELEAVYRGETAVAREDAGDIGVGVGIDSSIDGEPLELVASASVDGEPLESEEKKRVTGVSCPPPAPLLPSLWPCRRTALRGARASSRGRPLPGTLR